MSELPLTGAALLSALESGEVRVAERRDDGSWTVHGWVKEAILEIFRESPLAEHGVGAVRELWPFVDKEALSVRRFDVDSGVRLVPGGSSVRRGAHIGRGVVLMPPCYVNVGAYVGAESMIDSHALVGSCAQIGERVHVSAGAQIGGVLEPIGSRPVIVERGCLIGGQSGLYEGVLVRAGAVVATGVLLTGTTRVFDVVNERELGGDAERPLEIPARAVVVPGTRPGSGQWARERDLAVSCALIVKYRDEATDRRAALEDALR